MFSTKISKGKFPWALLGVESVIVVLSVLLALGLNSWRDNRNKNELAVRAIQSVVDEFSSNCLRVQNFHPYHTEVANGERESNGVQIGMIRNDSWASAQSIGASAYIDYDIASATGTIYALQNDHRTFIQSYMQALFTNIMGREGTGGMHSQGEIAVIREVVRIQEALLDSYKNLEILVDKKYGDEVNTGKFCEES